MAPKYVPPSNEDYYKDGPSTFVAPDYVTPLDPHSGERSTYAPGAFAPETAQYFDYHFKGRTADESQYRYRPCSASRSVVLARELVRGRWDAC